MNCPLHHMFAEIASADHRSPARCHEVKHDCNVDGVGGIRLNFSPRTGFKVKGELGLGTYKRAKHNLSFLWFG